MYAPRHRLGTEQSLIAERGVEIDTLTAGAEQPGDALLNRSLDRTMGK
jgi:hypothetical protein